MRHPPLEGGAFTFNIRPQNHFKKKLFETVLLYYMDDTNDNLPYKA